MEAAANTAVAGVRVRARRHRRRLATWGGFAAFLLALTGSIQVWGLPWSRDRLAVWIVLGLLAVSLSDLRRWGRGIVYDWLPLFGVLFSYDLLRGYADGLVSAAHTFPQLRADEWLFGGTAPTVTMQRALWSRGDPQWYDVAAWVVYTSHFFAALVVAACLWRFAYPRFRPFVGMFVALTLAGYATYVLFPAVPPWLAAWNGDLSPVDRIVPHMWSYVGVEPAAVVFQGGNRYANDVAALPSLHGAYPLLLALFFWRTASRRLRALLAAYPAAMAVTLVYSGEHYLVDILLGWLYAVAIFAAFALVSRRPERARSVRPHP